jgi:hypothetical protein
MTQEPHSFQSRRAFLFAAASISLVSCARDGSETEANIRQASKTFKMGERATVGLLTYNVLEASYFSQLGDVGNSKIPEKRFLVIRMSITNGGAKEAELPLFRVVDAQGVEIGETQNAEFLSGWFGLIRKVGPTQTEEGRILFDVSPKNYKLEVTDGGESGSEQFAFIEIPIEFDTAEPIPSSGGAQASPKP